MRVLIALFIVSLSLFAADPAPATTTPTMTGFADVGIAPGNQVLGGLGLATSVGAGQSIFAGISLQSGVGVTSTTQVMLGIKSDYPGFTAKGYKIVPFSIVEYGAAIQSLSKLTIKPPASLGLSASTVTSIATGAGLAQQYAAGFQTTLKSGVMVGVGMVGDKGQSGWTGYPFVFVGRSF